MTEDDKDNYEILLESKSPNCPLYLIVEENENCTYIYLNKMKDGEIESIICGGWVRNHKESQTTTDNSNMDGEYPLMLPGDYCNHPQGKARLNPDDLEAVWLEDGDGVALLEKGEILSIIASWCNTEFPPHAKDCTIGNPFAIPLTEENVLINTVKRAQEFWRSWDEDHWTLFRDERSQLLESYFGQHKNYYAIDRGEWPIKAMARYEIGDITYLVTIGVSIIPQPTVDLYTETPEDFRRFELGLAIKTDELMKKEMTILEFCSMVTRIPWDNIAWLGHGHTTECFGGFADNDSFPYGVFINSKEEFSSSN